MEAIMFIIGFIVGIFTTVTLFLIVQKYDTMNEMGTKVSVSKEPEETKEKNKFDAFDNLMSYDGSIQEVEQ